MPPGGESPPAPPSAGEAAASEAAALLAKRGAEARAARDDGDAAVRMVDLHDLRAELRGELARARKVEAVPHAVPEPDRAPAQPARGKVLPAVVGFLVVCLFLGLAYLAERRK